MDGVVFYAQCRCCGQRYENWIGSTPCCGSVSFLVENDQVTSKALIYTDKGEPAVMDFSSLEPGLRQIKAAHISKPDKKFACRVTRPQSKMRYHDPADGLWKPIEKEKEEVWTVWTEDREGALSVAKYHFMFSKSIEII